MESVFHICNCAENCQVKYATCTLLDSALTWWNSHMKIVGIDDAYAITWKELMKMMTKVYYHRNEIPKMENELWNLTVKDNDVVDYTQRFKELALLCPIKARGTFGVSQKTFKEIKWEDEQEENHRQQQNKRQEVGRVYVAGTGNKTGYAETLPLCDKCKLHHHDSEDSTVTYTEVSSPFADLSDIGSPGVDGPPVMPEDPYAYVVAAFQAPPSPDYVPGLEEPEQAPPSPVYVPYVPEPVYPEFMPPEDEVLPAEEQPLPAALSPTADSPGYVPESDPEEDPEEDDDEDPEEDPADYPADGGDDGDDEDESSNDDEDDDVDIEGDEEEEEHPAPADSTAVALPAVDHAPSAEETEPFETDESAATPPPHPAYRVTARISIRDEPPTPFWSDTEVARLLAIPTPPPSPLSLWSSPLG
ncbi:putative reverse transcriptase domain-containing protein [Tanacetum coccineum]